MTTTMSGAGSSALPSPAAEPRHLPPRPSAGRLPEPDGAAPSVLATARAIVARGWLQHGWCEGGPTGWFARLRQGPPRPEQVERACLVAAVVVAAHPGGPLVGVVRDAMPWIDAVWRALHEPSAPVPRALPPAEYPRRLRDLTAWNDAPRRTRDEVLALLSRADGHVLRAMPPSSSSRPAARARVPSLRI